MTEPLTVEGIDRETECLRDEKRGVMSALRACDGRGGNGPGRLLERLDALDRALEQLGERRLRAEAELRDPEASARRRERRAVALGRWLETRSLTLGQMRCIEALAGEAGCGLFAEEALVADGWRRDAHGWHGPLSPAAAAGPVGDVVVLAQARADVERTLVPSFEQTLSGGELVALDEPDDHGPVEPPEDIGDAERAASNDARIAAAFSREYAALMKTYAAARRSDGTRIGADGQVIDAYAELVQARARALVTERVAAARAAMAPSTRAQGTVVPPNAGPGPGK